jgi:hypothetical protein
MSAIDQLIDEFADRIASRVAERLRACEPGLIDQTCSPLGRRRHCAVVRARIARAQGGASIIGRRYLLSSAALAEELGRCSGPRRVSAASPSSGAVRSELERELRLLRGGDQR